jgi:hypothetical protein
MGLDDPCGRALVVFARRSIVMSTPTLERSRAELALQRSPIPALRKLSLEEDDAVVVIHGKVSSYYLKQLAQETVMPLLGQRQLCNRVAVVRDAAAAMMHYPN